MDDMVRRLQKRAYDQGYLKGQRGLPIARSDWEAEFQESYMRGYREGKADA